MPLEFNPPPQEKVQVIHNAIINAFKELPQGAKGGLFAVANETGANAVVVTKVPGGIMVQAYIGKTWNGSLNYGVNAMKTW